MSGTTPLQSPPEVAAGDLSDRLGRPLHDLRISVTDRCNFRCTYCMPADLFGEDYAFLPRSEVLTFEEVERLTRLFVALGVRKVRITGGEPLLRRDLPELINRLSQIDGVDDLTLTTNGFLLAEHAENLAGAGLDRVTVSLDSLDRETFQRMSGRNADLARVLAGIDAAAEAGLTPIKINCVVERGVNDAQVVDLARHFRGTGHVLRFIEFMDVGTRNGWDLTQVVSAREILDSIDAEAPLEPVSANYRGEVAQRYAYRDGSGEIGIISSVSQPFCGDCHRARLSADGRLVTCLFAAGGRDLKKPLREGASDAELLEILRGTWQRRTDRYSEERAELTPTSGRVRPKIEMYQIGG